MSGITFEVKQSIAILSTSTKGWSKQFNLVSWNGREAKFDIRDWDEKQEKMGRGISLSMEELLKLQECLNELELSLDQEEPLEIEIH
jgi:hypothetical protein